MLRLPLASGFIFVLGLFLIFVAPTLFSEGMFVDGSVYAAISQNLALGKGSLWNLFYTDCLYPQFNEHPPLAFLFQSWFYKLFGFSVFVERWYSLLCFIGIGALMHALWKGLFLNSRSWMALLFFILMPLVPWCASNNMLENTMAIFDLGALWFLIQALKSNRKYASLYTLCAAVCLMGAFLTKGFTGLYPLVSPMLWMLVKERRYSKHIMLQQVLLIVGFSTIMGLFFLAVPDALAAVERYFFRQVLRGITEEQTIGSRFYVLYKVLTESLIALALVLVLYLISKKKSNESILSCPPEALWLLIVGLSGVIPMIISLKQSGYYILTTLPLFALFIAATIAKVPLEYFERKRLKLWGQIGAILFLFLGVSLNLFFAGKINRDNEKVVLQKTVKGKIPVGSVISIDKDLLEDWGMHAYFARYNQVSLCNDETLKAGYVLTKEKNASAFHELIAETPHYFVYRKLNPE